MVSAFRRSLSFPIPRSFISTSSSLENPRSRHLRSTSLPCRFHPLISQLNDCVNDLRLWHSEQSASLAWLIDGLVRLGHLQDFFVDLLNLKSTHNTLRSLCRGRTGWKDHFLEDFLRFSDAYGTFRSAVVDLRQHHSATQAAIRGRNSIQIASCARSKRRAEKELTRLASAVRQATRLPRIELEDAAQIELAWIMSEVAMVTATVSAAIFVGISTVSRSTSVTSSRWSRVSIRLRRRLGRGSDEEKKRWGELVMLEVLEESMRVLEEKAERVFRSLANSRVSLLNTFCPCL